MNLMGRTPPHDIETEIVLLGACMMDAAAAAATADALAPGDFYRTGHQVIFDAIRRVLAEGGVPDYQTVLNALRSSNEIQKAGGEEYLADVAHAAPSASNARFNAQAVANHARLRRLIAWACETLKRAYTPGEDSEALAAEVLSGLVEANGNPGGIVALKEALHELTAVLDGQPDALPETIPLPYREIDEITGGLAMGEVYIVAGDEGGGKSTFAYNVIPAAAASGARTLVASYEVGPLRIAQCLTAIGSGVSAGYLYARRGQAMTAAEVLRSRRLDEQVSEYIGRAAGLPVDMVPGYPDLTKLNSVLTSAAVRRKPYKLLVLDHLHLMPYDRLERRGAGLEEQIRKNVNGLKELAQRHNLAALVLAQFTDKRVRASIPNVNDLKGSSAIKQAAASIILLHIAAEDWDAMKDERGLDRVRLGVGIEKNRYGRVGQRIWLNWHLPSRAITDF